MVLVAVWLVAFAVVSFEYPAFSRSDFATAASPVVPVPFCISMETLERCALEGVEVGVADGATVGIGVSVGVGKTSIPETNGDGVGFVVVEVLLWYKKNPPAAKITTSPITAKIHFGNDDCCFDGRGSGKLTAGSGCMGADSCKFWSSIFVRVYNTT